jgi:uncharacterized protein
LKKSSDASPNPLVNREILSAAAGAVESPAMLRRAWLKIERWALYNGILLCRIRGATERVARGFALGLIVNFFPTFGFGVFISGFFARMFGGNMAAGIVGGGLLTFVWPILFYVNIRMGSVFQAPVVPLEELEDVTERTISTLVWGTTFAIGALINAILVGLTVYFVLLLLYDRMRPKMLDWFRTKARDHQQRLRQVRETRPQAIVK